MEAIRQQEESIRTSIINRDKDLQREIKTLAEAVVLIEDIENRLYNKKTLKAEAKDRGISVNQLKKGLGGLLRFAYQTQKASLNYCTNRQREIKAEVQELLLSQS